MKTFPKVSTAECWYIPGNCTGTLQNGTLHIDMLQNGNITQSYLTKQYSCRTVDSPKTVHVTKQYITERYSYKMVCYKTVVTKW